MRTQSLFKTFVFGAGLVLGSLACAQMPAAMESPAGVKYLSGGVGSDARAEMKGLKQQYSFMLTTAARKSGEFLAGVHVRVLEARTRKELIDDTMDGPWFFADLAPGQYELELNFQPGSAPVQTRRNIIAIKKGGHRQMMFYFDVPGAMMPAKAKGGH